MDEDYIPPEIQDVMETVYGNHDINEPRAESEHAIVPRAPAANIQVNTEEPKIENNEPRADSENTFILTAADANIRVKTEDSDTENKIPEEVRRAWWT